MSNDETSRTVNPLLAALSFALASLVLGVVLSVVMRDSRTRTPVTLQQNLLDKITMKVVPVYPDESDEDARKRLLASVECSPYLILDEGVSTWMYHGFKAGENYYRYMKCQCTGQAVG
jgi:hypothetical protein